MEAEGGVAQATKQVAAGNPAQALATLDALPGALAASAEAQRVRAQALILLGDGDGAHRTLLAARQQHPHDADVLVELGRLYIKANAPQPAVDTFQSLASMHPDDIRAAEGLADVLLAVGDHARAIPFLRQILASRPEASSRARQLGHALMLSGNAYQAAEQLEPLIDKFPDNGATALLSGEACYNSGLIDRAVRCFGRVAPGPHHDAARSGIVKCLVREGKLEDAIALAEDEIQRGSARAAELYLHQCAAHAFRNDREAAERACSAALAINPDDANAWFARAELGGFLCGDQDLQRLQRLSETAAPDDRARVCFSLARMHADRENIDEEMRWLDKGNALVSASRPYDAAGYDALFDAIRTAFPPLDEVPAGPADERFRPVFVLGMPRSGTTLTEQILTSHPDIDGSGESLAFLHAAGGQGFESRIAGMNASWVARFAEEYTRYQREAGFCARWVTDKAMSLHFFVGMLQRAFPQARFIALHRHPLDLALGGWRKHFVSGHGYTYEPRRFAHALALYRRAIDYWAGQDGINLLQLDYESLVADPEAWSRRLAEHVGVPFDDRMLSPEDNQRQVLTASAAQIRDGINLRSVGRWRAYRDHLGVFVDALAEFSVDCEV